MRVLFAAAFATLLVACGPATPPAPPPPTAAEVTAESAKLTAFLDAAFEEELAMNPLALTQMGAQGEV